MSIEIYLKGTSIKIKCSDIDIDENLMDVKWSYGHKYWKYKGRINPSTNFTVGKIYKTKDGATIYSHLAFIDNNNNQNGYYSNKDFFTPVTKKQYKAQQAKIKQPEHKKEVDTYSKKLKELWSLQ